MELLVICSIFKYKSTSCKFQVNPKLVAVANLGTAND